MLADSRWWFVVKLACLEDGNPKLMVHVLRAAINEVILICTRNAEIMIIRLIHKSIYVVRLVLTSSTTRMQSSP